MVDISEIKGPFHFHFTHEYQASAVDRSATPRIEQKSVENHRNILVFNYSIK